jgi:hypothetical protein
MPAICLCLGLSDDTFFRLDAWYLQDEQHLNGVTTTTKSYGSKPGTSPKLGKFLPCPRIVRLSNYHVLHTSFSTFLARLFVRQRGMFSYLIITITYLMPFYGLDRMHHVARMVPSLPRVRNWASTPFRALIMSDDLTIVFSVFGFDIPCTTLRTITWYVVVSHHHEHTLMPFYDLERLHYVTHMVPSLARARN